MHTHKNSIMFYFVIILSFNFSSNIAAENVPHNPHLTKEKNYTFEKNVASTYEQDPRLSPEEALLVKICAAAIEQYLYEQAKKKSSPKKFNVNQHIQKCYNFINTTTSFNLSRSSVNQTSSINNTHLQQNTAPDLLTTQETDRTDTDFSYSRHLRPLPIPNNLSSRQKLDTNFKLDGFKLPYQNIHNPAFVALPYQNTYNPTEVFNATLNNYKAACNNRSNSSAYNNTPNSSVNLYQKSTAYQNANYREKKKPKINRFKKTRQTDSNRQNSSDPDQDPDDDDDEKKKSKRERRIYKAAATKKAIDEAKKRIMKYTGNPKHHINSQGRCSKPPHNGQKALDKSVFVQKDPQTGLCDRIAIENGKVIKFHEHAPGQYHGYIEENVRSMEQPYKNALYQAGFIRSPKSCKIIK